MQQRSLSVTSAHYYFSRIKDVCTEKGQTIITLFGRLTIETPEHSFCIWADAIEVAWTQADCKLKTAPNGIYTFEVQEPVFRELERLSRDRQNALYTLTPCIRRFGFLDSRQFLIPVPSNKNKVN